MAKSIATLTIGLVAESATLQADLQKARKSTTNWAKQTRSQVNAVGKVFGGLAIASGAALAAIYADSAKSADSLAKLSDQLGEAPERITALQHAAELTGASTEMMNSSLARMTKRIGEAKEGIGAGVAGLEQLGLKTEKFFNLSPADQFAIISDRVNGLATQQDKAAAAAALFGREGLALVNTMALGSEGLAGMEQEVNDLGIALDRIQLAKIEAANDEFHRAKTITSAFGNTLAAEVAPIVGALSNEFVSAAKEAGGFSNIVKSGMGKTAAAIGVVADTVRALELVWEGLKLAVARSYEFMLSGLGTLETGFRRFMNLLPGVSVSTQSALGGMSKAFGAVADEMSESFNNLSLAPLPSEEIKNWVQNASDTAQKAAEEVAANREGNILGSLLGDSGQLGNEKDAKEAAKLAKELERQKVSQQAKLESVDLFLMTEEERLAESYARRQEIISNAHEMGLISDERRNTLALELAAKHAEDLEGVQSEMGEFAKSAAQNMQSSFADFLFNPFDEGLGGMLKGFGEMIQRMIAEAASAKLMNSLFGDMGKTGDIGGIVGGFMKSFDGGGSTGTGARSGGVDGKGGFVALLHPNETVIDHTKGQSANRGGSMVINQSINVAPITERRTANQIANAAARRQRMAQSRFSG